MLNEYPDDADTIHVCANCVGDSFLKETIRSDGHEDECSYCHATCSTFSLGEFSDRIHDVLQEQFYLTDSEPDGTDYVLAKEGLWERSGEPVVYVIADISGLDEAIAEDVRAYLSDLHGFSAVKDGGEDLYADDAQYEERGPDDLNFYDTWKSFCQQVRWRSRFFSQYAEVDLDNIFGDLENLRTLKGTSVIREISPADDDRFVFRARVAFSSAELEDILKHPARKLGAPPSRRAQAGRMNAAGISVFYGAQDRGTCVAEVRAPVGSSVILGRFEFVRPVRLLDLDALAEVYVEGSHFDPDFGERRGRAAFLSHLAQMISRPVMPSDETFEYLPTQVVSEYLATRAKPPVDGMLFRSSQTGGKGRNLVMFNHASVAEPDDVPPNTEFSVLMDSGPPDDPDPTITVFEKVPPKKPPKEKEGRGDPFGFSSPPIDPLPSTGDDEVWLASRELTLRLDTDSVRVLHVYAVQYRWHERNVTRMRLSKDEEEPF